jgi:hypothetical protein
MILWLPTIRSLQTIQCFPWILSILTILSIQSIP